MTMIIRFVDIIKLLDSEMFKSAVIIRKHFLGFVPLDETTGAFIIETWIEKPEQMELQIENLRGQGYDNGSNMKRKRKRCTKQNSKHKPASLFYSLQCTFFKLSCQ